MIIKDISIAMDSINQEDNIIVGTAEVVSADTDDILDEFYDPFSFAVNTTTNTIVISKMDYLFEDMIQEIKTILRENLEDNGII